MRKATKMNEINNLRKLRYEAELSLKELSGDTGISLTVLSYLESGKRSFRQEHIDQLCSFFGVSSDYLLGRSDKGIGVYFVDLERNDAEYRMVSEGELEILKEGHKLTTSVRVATSGDETGQEFVYRSASAECVAEDKLSRLREELMNEVNTMNEKELEKTIRFIKDYIK